MPVPRRFDRRPPERDTTRTNERIRVPEVRLIDDEGKQVGVLKIADALEFAQERELDLVEVAPDARPPVCRVLDYSKYKYEQAQKQKQARKHQQQITIREIKFRPKIAQHDYDTKKSHVERFLCHKDKVKITIMFRGREVTHPERGTAILDRLASELEEIGVVEQRPMQEGRNMTMMMAPSKAVLSGRVGAGGAEQEAHADGEPEGAAAHAGAADEPAAGEGAVAAAAAAQGTAGEGAADAQPGEAGAAASGEGEGAAASGEGEGEGAGVQPGAGAAGDTAAAGEDAQAPVEGEAEASDAAAQPADADAANGSGPAAELARSPAGEGGAPAAGTAVP